ncbi:hypothetical protein T07_14258 [Trichinella nelsoni]|uniref:Uncharacterized protein n=1 Tax=Trichinella nelsoni TaxID=6336 RepID=A0A0V0SMH2_9BILA|nr:hypothetical protein T07_14258 [Trichinella nelsoni]
MFHSRPVNRSVVMESCGESLQHHQWIYSHVFDSFSRIQNYKCLIMAMVKEAHLHAIYMTDELKIAV